MIIVLIIATTLLTFVSWCLISSKTWCYLLGSLSLITFVASIYALTDHFVNHTGMALKTDTSTQTIYSAAPNQNYYNLLLYSPIGKKATDTILIYRDKASDKTASKHFVPDMKNPTEAIKISSNFTYANVPLATLTTKKTHYTFTSKLAKLLYGFAKEDKELISESNLVTLPQDNWIALTPEQNQSLGSELATITTSEQLTNLKKRLLTP
ncbi:DUF4811 domain-containing protein [Streptococcus sp. zg-JUN1979]|uniref:DUF4811 domain-containing protein n=1 Tax=Streptococcus sp. zg-JUN1979 TaxID=3391450 RepID=UPI0039A5D0E7